MGQAEIDLLKLLGILAVCLLLLWLAGKQDRSEKAEKAQAASGLPQTVSAMKKDVFHDPVTGASVPLTTVRGNVTGLANSVRPSSAVSSTRKPDDHFVTGALVGLAAALMSSPSRAGSSRDEQDDDRPGSCTAESRTSASAEGSFGDSEN